MHVLVHYCLLSCIDECFTLVAVCSTCTFVQFTTIFSLQNGATPLYCAAVPSNVDAVNTLVSAGFNDNERDEVIVL